MVHSNSIFPPSGDELITEALNRTKRLRQTRVDLTLPYSGKALKHQVEAILSLTAIGRSLLSECSGVRYGKNDVFTVECPNKKVACHLMRLYVSCIEKDGDWRTLPKILQFRWKGCSQAIKVPYSFAANFPKSTINQPPVDPEEPAAVEPEDIVPPPLTFAEIVRMRPQHQEEEPFFRLWDADKPATILSMRTEKVIAANRLVVGFCPEQYDDIIGYNIRQLFEQEPNHPRYQPTNLTAFHEELKRTHEFEGDIFSWRSSGIFARYPIRAEYFVFAGGSYRLTFFDPIEIIY
ncbi:hypothetical protein ACQ4M3_29075 [Leptolyngbya sp. AN03gr2]|uniref:hypothetical protein n=1 Tax=unclassified Leptolyngbya TaxID=2650499 RepID=UPI003D3101A3